jgi:hypothetical protein
MVNPWHNGSIHGSPTVRGPAFAGNLPTGTPVFDPWNSRATVTPAVPALQSVFGYQYAMQNSSFIWNPSLYPYWAATGQNVPWGLNGTNGFMQPGGFGPGIQPVPAGAVPVVSSFASRPGLGVGPATQVEPGWFSRVGPDLAVNRTTGTVLRPYSGVAYTAVVRLPGSGTFTPWGAYLPGTGVYVNPFTGAAYNPQTGLILR